MRRQFVRRRRFVPRILSTTMLGSPVGFIGGSGSRFGAGGSSLSSIAFQRRTRGLSGNRSAAIVARSRAAIVAYSSAERFVTERGLPPSRFEERELT